MDNREKIGILIRQRLCIIKGMGILFWFPVLINNILVPIMVFISYSNYGYGEKTYNNIVYYVQIFSPFFSTFWIYLHMVKYIDTKGKEIFYITNRIKMKEIIFLYIFYIFTNTVPFIWYIKMYSRLVFEWLHLIMVYFFLCAMAYCMCYLFRSVALAILPVLCYTFLAITGSDRVVPVWSYYEPNGMEIEMFREKYVWFLLGGIFFLVAGRFLNERYTDY